MTLSRILGFRLVTGDAGRLVAFYGALGFRVGERRPIARGEMAMLGIAGAGERIALTLGDQWIELDAYGQAGRPYPADATAADPVFQHFALVTDDADAMWRRARAAGATPISRDGPVTLPPSSGGARAVKFRDPEGHPLELLQFPDPASHPRRGRGLRGIDHSAIAVADAPRSVRFYGGQGLSAADGTLNEGGEQDRLDGLDDVEVRVRPMTPSHGPAHLELLGYRRPSVRPRAVPAANDVAATRIVWSAGHAGLLRDPDGHLHQLSS